MSDLKNRKPNPAQHTENGHITALRKGAAFVFDPLTVAIDIGLSVDVRFTTGDLAVIFEGATFAVDQEFVTFQVFEDVVFSNNGVLNSTYIRKANRMSGRDSQVQTYDGAVVDTLGPLVLHDIVRGQASQGQNKPGFGTGSNVAETVLKPNTEHTFRITNGSAAIVNVEPHSFFREENPLEYADQP